MCGIAGLVWNKPVRNSEEKGGSIVSTMLRAMQHRGPDGDGLIAQENFALGHLRLSIIDPEHGAQPMSCQTDKIHLSYNGEIYNYKQHREKQINQGWQFTTHSDSETLLAGYTIDGVDFDSDLNGMYAYAIVDQRPGKNWVQLGIDPVGIKPLYVTKCNHVTLFASEIRAILAAIHALGENVSLDRAALGQYLQLGWTPPPNTLLSNVMKLEPGNRLQIDLRSATITPLQTRSMPKATVEPTLEIGEVLEKVVRRQIIADTPLGFFLSGGIDSSLLVATAKHIGVQPKTFTVRFSGEGHGISEADESEVARQVAEYCGAEHHELTVSANTLRDDLDNALRAMDQPIADPACLPLLVLARFAREHVKVCLSGDGGDELFLGYPRHRLLKYKANWKRIPSFARETILRTAQCFPLSPSQGLPEKLRKIRVGINLLNTPQFFAGPFSGCHASMLNQCSLLPIWASHVSAVAEDVFEADMLGQLAGQMLPKTDHVTMFAGLETRVPFLDHEMISVAQTIPISEKIKDGMNKAPLRKLLENYLPHDISKRPKQGFRVPLTSWFRYDLAKDVQDRLLGGQDYTGGLIERSAIEALLKEHISGQAEHSIRIWALLALQSWLSQIEVQ